MDSQNLAQFGPWGLVFVAITYIAKLLILKGYSLRIEFRPKK
jgi:hypothetical protein